MRHSHVYVVASGFGLRVVPIAPPFQFALGPLPSQLDTLRTVDGKELFARLTPDAGGYKSQISEGTSMLSDVLDVVEGPQLQAWWLETSAYRVPLPRAWRAIAGDDPSQPSIFDLVGPGDSLMFVQTPRNPPDPDRLCGPGQRIRARGSDARSAWVELRYSLEGRDWAQRHDVLRLGGLTCALTVQSPESCFEAIAPTHQSVLNSIAPSTHDS